MMRSICNVLGGVCLLLTLWVPVQAQSGVEVDWNQGMVKSVGKGFSKEGLSGKRAQMMAEKAAQVMALRDMAEFIQGIQLTSETTVEEAMLTGDVVKARVNSVIRQAQQVGKTQYDATLAFFWARTRWGQSGLPMLLAARG